MLFEFTNFLNFNIERNIRFCQEFDIRICLCYNVFMSLENQLIQEYLQDDLESQLEGYRIRLAESKIFHEKMSKNASTAVNKRDFKLEASAIGKILKSPEITKQIYFKFILNKLLGINRTPYKKLYLELKRKPSIDLKEKLDTAIVSLENSKAD